MIYRINDSLNPLRVVRLGLFSAFDTLGAIGFMVAITPLVNWIIARWGRRVTYFEMVALTLPVGFAAHLVFGMDTPFVKMFFAEGNFLPAIVLGVLAIFGLRGFIKKRDRGGKSSKHHSLLLVLCFGLSEREE